MSFYNLSREERVQKVREIHGDLLNFLLKKSKKLPAYFSDEDTYIRKVTYQSIGKIYTQRFELQQDIVSFLENSLTHQNHLVRQTVVNAAGEIGMKNFDIVSAVFDKGLLDEHHTVRNAVIGSVKKMGEKNPVPVMEWAKKYLNHPDKEIRREICHGIELRGRKYPQDILPLLKELQHDETPRVRNTLVHVIGQIAYKKGCIETVIAHLKHWENKQLVADALEEIIDVHYRYRNFSALTQDEAREYIANNF